MQDDKKTIRYTLAMSLGYCNRLRKLSDELKINQGEVIEVLLDHMTEDALNAMRALRANKVIQRASTRSEIGELASILNGLSKEQRDQLIESARKAKS